MGQYKSDNTVNPRNGFPNNFRNLGIISESNTEITMLPNFSIENEESKISKISALPKNKNKIIFSEQTKKQKKTLDYTKTIKALEIPEENLPKEADFANLIKACGQLIILAIDKIYEKKSFEDFSKHETFACNFSVVEFENEIRILSTLSNSLISIMTIIS